MNNCACQNQNNLKNNNKSKNNLKKSNQNTNNSKNRNKNINNSERIYNYMNNLKNQCKNSNNSKDIKDLKKECILNSRIFFMPETEFDEIDDGIYKVLFIGRNNAYLFKSINEIKQLTPSISTYEYKYQDIPKYHLSKFDSKVIFDNVKNKIFMRTKVLNITYRDYDIRLICKSKDNKNKYKQNLSEYQDYVHNYLYPRLKKIELSIRISENCLKVIRLYNDKELLKDYDKYSGIYYPDEDFEYKLKNQFITRYKPDNLLIEFENLEDDEIKLYDNEYGFMKARMYYKPHSETEYCEIRVYCKEEYDDNDEIDDDLIYDRKSHNNRRRERLNENIYMINEVNNDNSQDLADYDEDLEYLIDEENNYYNDRYIQLKRSNKNKKRRIINYNNIYNNCSELHDLKELFEDYE